MALTLILGPMFASKTTMLNMYFRRCLVKGQKPLLIRYTLDERYPSHSSGVVTHDRLEIETEDFVVTGDLGIVADDLILRHDVIFIDEVQFYANVMAIKHWLELGRDVYATGLNGDYLMSSFNNVSELIPLANKIKKRHGVCTRCYHKGDFTHRLSTETAQIVIGSGNYVCVCRKCHMELCENHTPAVNFHHEVRIDAASLPGAEYPSCG